MDDIDYTFYYKRPAVVDQEYADHLNGCFRAIRAWFITQGHIRGVYFHEIELPSPDAGICMYSFMDENSIFFPGQNIAFRKTKGTTAWRSGRFLYARNSNGEDKYAVITTEDVYQKWLKGEHVVTHSAYEVVTLEGFNMRVEADQKATKLNEEMLFRLGQLETLADTHKDLTDRAHLAAIKLQNEVQEFKTIFKNYLTND